MKRKTRRKIKRRTQQRKRNKIRKKKGFLYRHFNSYPSNKWTKLTTYVLILFEAVFVIWWLQELLLNWEEIVMKLKQLFGG